MPFYQRLGITLAAMLIVSFSAGLLVRNLFGVPLPDYAAGMVGGLTAIPVWDFLKRVRPKQ